MWAPLPIVPVLIAVVPEPAHAHAAAGHEHPVWTWNPDPVVLVPILALNLLYVVGIVRLWRRAGVGRGVPVWRALSYAAGLVALLLALASPLDPAADSSFALHMAQHMLLMVVAAPLMVLGNFGVAALTALPGRIRVPLGRSFASGALRRVRARLFALPLATAVHGVVVWLWHAPALYEAALAERLIHYLEHLTMFGSAVVFWWSALGASRRGTLGYGAGAGALFLTMLHTGLLGILITLAPAPLYASYAVGTPWAALGPLEDQQLAGMVMLIPGGLAYLAGGLALLAAWLAEAEARTPAGWPAAARTDDARRLRPAERSLLSRGW